MRFLTSTLITVSFGLLLGACATQPGDPAPYEDVGEEIQALKDCDPDLICPEVLTCVDGLEYPTACGPDNCDEPVGKCCDPEMICQQVLTCVDGLVYPTACGPDNCDEPIGKCCDPNMICQQVLTCVDGLVYPTACGPDNCDEPIGKCH